MTEKIDDGGPAFPMVVDAACIMGCTKRDLFAAMNMAAMHARDTHDSGLASPQQRAAIALIDADALLAALKSDRAAGCGA
jgi:hypothetical protein